jgi:tetratricopeptide (TPR) repeat protein
MIRLLLTLLLAGCFTLAVVLDAPMRKLRPQTEGSGSVVGALMGESRQMFGYQLFVEADVYFHSGFYPSIFDVKETNMDVNEREAADAQKAAPANGRRPKTEEGEGFLGAPRDWVEGFGRHFIPTQHTHLAGGKVREILPWLRLSADMDPHRIQTYLTASYWLRGELGEPDQAEQFLREGLRANPGSYEILIELGYVFDENKQNPRVARNVFAEALQEWKKQDAAGQKPPLKACIEILDGLVRTDGELNDLQQMLADLESLKAISPSPDEIEKTIQETRAKLAAPPPGRSN